MITSITVQIDRDGQSGLAFDGGTKRHGPESKGNITGIKISDSVVKSRMGPQAMTSMHLHFEEYEDARVLVVRCPRSRAPVFVKDGEVERFYVRTGPATTEMPASQTQAYIKQRFAH